MRRGPRGPIRSREGRVAQPEEALARVAKVAGDRMARNQRAEEDKQELGATWKSGVAEEEIREEEYKVLEIGLRSTLR
ncbi:hypothetical protein L596_028157 [Steinernema carpocapsae]|uniref:Uncharacterized protein n=1 Tax=Steinernema carpocapsae TaxID=34508 RepID=A0A4U5LXP5_STECR|nr:hypothetical protein L596_028157 [Steinernema carpocapsae]